MIPSYGEKGAEILENQLKPNKILNQSLSTALPFPANTSLQEHALLTGHALTLQAFAFASVAAGATPPYNYFTTTPRHPVPAPEITVQISHLSDSSTIPTPWSPHDTFFFKCRLQKWCISPEFSCYIDPQNFLPQLYSLWQFLQEEN
ncbi:hypothetical protein HJG60_008474 [Phyllostomus discolor]|uniref:Uncharacterized protein n=1 Tax=Phyllostomus discolor TaxID=89673 RepID=A0A833Z552_9CHIR|nr:hypothetical protein HJG60_008474 [Phyllostomus discolor]